MIWNDWESKPAASQHEAAAAGGRLPEASRDERFAVFAYGTFGDHSLSPLRS